MALARNSASNAGPNVPNGGMATCLVPFSMILADCGPRGPHGPLGGLPVVPSLGVVWPRPVLPACSSNNMPA